MHVCGAHTCDAELRPAAAAQRQRQVSCWTDKRDCFLSGLLEALILASVGVVLGVEPAEFVLLVLLGELLQNFSHANVRVGFGTIGGQGSRQSRVSPASSHACRCVATRIASVQFFANVPDLGHPVQNCAVWRSAARDGRERLKYFSYFREAAPYGIKDESLRERIALQYRQVSLKDMVDVSTAGYAHFPVRSFCEIRHIMSRCLRRLDQVTCPVLLVQALNDDITGPKNSEVIYRGIRSSRKEIVLLHDSYHVVTADLEREKLAREVARFCDSCKGTEFAAAGAPGTP